MIGSDTGNKTGNTLSGATFLVLILDSFCGILWGLSSGHEVAHRVLGGLVVVLSITFVALLWSDLRRKKASSTADESPDI